MGLAEGNMLGNMVGNMFPSEEKYGPRLNLSLCHCSSEDVDRPASALRYQTRSTCGWQSDKGCVYPQELGFVFDGEVDLHFIRVLSHENKITTRIEVFISEATEEEIEKGTVKPYRLSTFRRLGYVCFVSNSGNALGARELKTINIRQKCVYVKLLISRPHQNHYNIFHQVGIVALTSHGTLRRPYQVAPTKGICFVGEKAEVPLDEMFPPRLESKVGRQTNGEGGGEGDNDMKVDHVTLRRIGEIMLMKENAVASEDYDLAHTLKLCLTALEDSGKKIYELEKQKTAAVKEEDYALAKKLKQQIDTLREESYKIPTEPPRRIESSELSNRPGVPLSRPEDTWTNDDLSNDLPKRKEQPLPTAQTAAPSPSLAFDETPVGGRGYYELESAVKVIKEETDGSNNNNNNNNNNSNSTSGNNLTLESYEGKEEWEKSINRIILRLSGEHGQAPALRGEAMTEARSSENVFGTYCCACLFGKKGPLREAAIRAIISSAGFASLSSHSQNVMETLLMYMALPSRGLSDSVAGVVLACCEALQVIIKGDIPDAPSVSSLMSYIQPLLQELVIRSGDNNNRIRHMAESILMGLSDAALDPLVSALLHDPEKTKKRPTSARVHVLRLNMIDLLVDRYGVDGSESMNLETNTVLSKVVLQCLQHSNGEVRMAASKLFAKLLFLDPDRSSTYLTALKPAQQSLIEQQVMRLKVGETEETIQTNGTLHSDANETSSSLSLPRHPSGGAQAAHRAVKSCQFCGESDDNFSEAALDIHFIRACPMLCPCPLCDQVTEIATLQQHLTTECENKHLVRECPICKEAVRVEDIKKHVAAKRCIKAVPTHSVCPLCHARFLVGSAGWLAHLAAPPGCPNNPRKYDGSGPIL